ncbi:MAG: hypothetical protein IRZ24_19150 [Thermogemmatispora sp.]|uniref:hypothetical protein n=1 Tax=Thermogemmatispora sp. TaxID=1968838 RepID=UPI001E004213|nr:hypothetical protein [Thermogemmatispora sp.]MBX5452189.1 hypothetical protein [Thermogemmatispora sp.]
MAVNGRQVTSAWKQRVSRMVRRFLGRLYQEGSWEQLARVAVVLPFLDLGWQWIEMPPSGERFPVVSVVASIACVHELLLVLEECGEEELYRECERILLWLQEEETRQVQQVAALMRQEEGAAEQVLQWSRWMVQGEGRRE